MAASYPSSARTFTTKSDGAGNTIFAAHVNDLQEEVTAVEQAMLSGIAHNWLPSTDAARALGSASFRWTELYASGSVRVGGTVATTGLMRLANNDGVAWRNVGNSTNLLLKVNASDQFEFSGGPVVPLTDDAQALGTASRRWSSVLVSAFVAVGPNPASAGSVRLPNTGQITSRNAANSADVNLLALDGSNRVVLAIDGNDILWGRALVALGGGAAPTLGTIGGSGPATAAQASWLRVIDSTGTARFIPVWS